MDELVRAIAAAMTKAGDDHIDEGERLRAEGKPTSNINDWRDMDMEILARAAIDAIDQDSMRREIAYEQIITLANELGSVTERLKAAEKACRKLKKAAKTTALPNKEQT